MSWGWIHERTISLSGHISWEFSDLRFPFTQCLHYKPVSGQVAPFFLKHFLYCRRHSSFQWNYCSLLQWSTLNNMFLNVLLQTFVMNVQHAVLLYSVLFDHHLETRKGNYGKSEASPGGKTLVTGGNNMLHFSYLEQRGRGGGIYFDGVFTSQSRQSAKLILQSSELGLPHPLTRRRVCPPPLVPGGGAHSLAREGVGEYQYRRRDIHCGTIYMYFVIHIIVCT